MADTVLGGAIEFLKTFGFFDVILPFLLVFTVVFGLLEKTKIFGTEDKKPKKNIDSMVAFAVGLFFVLATKLVDVLKEALPQITMVLIALIAFMLLVGSMSSGEKEFSFEKQKGWMIFLGILMFIAVILIGLNAFGKLEGIWDWTKGNWNSPIGGTIILIAIIVGAMYMLLGNKPGKPAENK